MRIALVLTGSLAIAGALLAAAPSGGPPPSEPPAVAMDAPARPLYAWPLRGPVLRPFEEPAGPYASGHRGIDIGAPAGTVVRAAQDGTVAFAGRVAGGLFVSIDHPDGIRTTYSWLSGVDAERGESVARGQAIGRSGDGHPASETPHLHFGARLGTRYLDPMLLLERGSLVGLVRLAPLEEGNR